MGGGIRGEGEEVIEGGLNVKVFGFRIVCFLGSLYIFKNYKKALNTNCSRDFYEKS